MKTARIILICWALSAMASVALATEVPNYMVICQQAEKWYKSEGSGKTATLRIHTQVKGSYGSSVILERETWLNTDVIEAERLLFQKDVDGNILFYGDLDDRVFDDPILWVKAPLAVGKTWIDSRPEIPCCTDPENMIHYVFAVLDSRDVTCPAGTFSSYRVFMSVLYPDGHTENQTFWYNPVCGLVMWTLDNMRTFELAKAIIPGLGEFPDVELGHPVAEDGLSGLKACPNPLNPMTTISFDLPNRSQVALKIYDVSGKLVRTLISNEIMDPGTRSVQWNGNDDRGSPAASGTYIYNLQAGGAQRSNSMTLIR